MSAESLAELVARQGGRLVAAAEAVRVVEPGHRVMVPIGSQPLALGEALAARLAEFEGAGVEMADCAVAANFAWLQPGYPGVSSVVHEHWGGPVVRAQQRAATHDYLPIPFSLRHKAMGEAARTEAEARRADVVLVQTTLPDHHGFVSFGPNAWNQARFCREARFALAEMSANIPWAFGEGHTLHVSELHALVHNDSPRRVTTVVEPTETQRRIAGYVGELVRDGDTLQLGAGQAPAACVTAGAFEGKRDLGWHSEATIGGVIDLMMRGAVNGERKTIDRGLAVATGYSGNAEQIEWVRLHPKVHTRPTEYVHNLRVIAGQERMVAINAAMLVDLTGQICADSIGHELVGGTGGQLEFAFGALSAKDGRSLTLMESTGLGGTASSIVATLPPGTVVSVPRLYADMIVTEFGVARLFGKTVRERARELAAIAHPRFREGLLREARELFGA